MILRAAVCKYREFNIKTEISKFFISSHENPLVKHFGTSQSKFPNNYLFRKKRSKVKYCVHAIPALCQSPKIIAKKPSGRKAVRGNKFIAVTILFTTLKNTIIIFLSPKKFCIIIVFGFSWDDCKSQKKPKTMVIQNFGGNKKIIMVFSKVANLVKILQDNAFFTRLKIDRGSLSSAHFQKTMKICKTLKEKSRLGSLNQKTNYT